MPAFGALALLVLTGAMMYGLTLGFAALHGWLHDVSMTVAIGYIKRELPVLTLVQVLAMGTALVVGLKLFDPDTEASEALSLRPVRTQTLAVCLVSGALLQFPLSELSNVLHAYVFGPDALEAQLALQNMIEAHTLFQGVLVVGCLAAVVPLAEELLFRGLFLFGLERRYGSAFALLVSSCFFGIMHMQAVPSLCATVAGFVLGGLALATRSVWPGVAVHAAVNMMPVLLPERVLAIHGFNVPSETVLHLSGWLVWVPLALGLGLLATVRRIEYATRP